MFRGFEIILKGKDPQAGLIVTPRICGICGGSHLYKSCYALDTAWNTHVPRRTPPWCATSPRPARPCSRCPRWFYALFAIDLTNKNYANCPLYEEIVKRRFAPYRGHLATSWGSPVRQQAGGGLRHLRRAVAPLQSFMVPGGVMCGPTLSDVTRSIAILDNWKR